MSGAERYNILIVDPDSQSRGTLKQAALSLTTFKKVAFCSTLTEAVERGSGFEPVDVVTVSYRFPSDEVAQFVKDAKGTPKGKDWAFVAVLKTGDQRNEVIAQSMLSGIDGFLFEPYSADNLREMAEVTARVRLRNEASRRRGALEVFIKEISVHLDAVAFYVSQGREATLAKKKLHEACKNLDTFRNDNFEIYVEVAIEVFSEIPPPIGVRYQGVSKRVRDRLKAKMLSRLESEYKE